MNRTQDTESRLVSINVSRPRTVRYHGREISTGIFKEPVSGRVMVRQLNIEGDAQADLRVHGGVEKAVYVYAAEHYDRWQTELRQDLAYGQFGENLTVTGITEEGIHVGDVLAVGDALLEVTQPRFPCFKLGIKMGDQRFLRRFLQSGRTGFYCRVLEEGSIGVGDAITIRSRMEDQPTIAEIVRQVRDR